MTCLRMFPSQGGGGQAEAAQGGEGDLGLQSWEGRGGHGTGPGAGVGGFPSLEAGLEVPLSRAPGLVCAGNREGQAGLERWEPRGPGRVRLSPGTHIQPGAGPRQGLRSELSGDLEQVPLDTGLRCPVLKARTGPGAVRVPPGSGQSHGVGRGEGGGLGTASPWGAFGGPSSDGPVTGFSPKGHSGGDPRIQCE